MRRENRSARPDFFYGRLVFACSGPDVLHNLLGLSNGSDFCLIDLLRIATMNHKFPVYQLNQSIQ